MSIRTREISLRTRLGSLSKWARTLFEPRTIGGREMALHSVLRAAGARSSTTTLLSVRVPLHIVRDEVELKRKDKSIHNSVGLLYLL